MTVFPTIARRRGRTEGGAVVLEPVGRELVAEPFVKRPISFESNRGQIDAEVKFVARGAGYSFFLTATEAVLAWSGNERSSPFEPSSKPDVTAPSVGLSPAVVGIRLLGSEPARLTGLDPLPAKANYFIGDDPEAWLTNVPTYARVRREEVYPGVDVVYHGDQQELEYDFVLAPGVDPGVIRIRFHGAEDIRVDSEGSLTMRVGDEALRQRAPLAYQEIGGTRREIPSRYVVRRDGTIGFLVGSHDPTEPLVIDPVLVYSTYLGGTGTDPYAPASIVVDTAGNAYVTGGTLSTDFPTTAGAFQGGNNGGRAQGCVNCDGFVTKYDASGSIVYSTYLGGRDGANTPEGIAVDFFGNAYVIGSTESTDFPIVGGVQATYGGGIRDAFVASLNSSGSELLYSTYLGGAGQDQGTGIDTDAAGTIFVTGSTESGDFPTARPEQPALAGTRDLFVAKLGEPGCGDAITDQVDILRSRFYSIFFSRFFFQWVIVRNGTTEPIEGPLAYVMKDLQNAVFLNTRTKTVCFSPGGDPFVVIRAKRQGTLEPGEWVFALLFFYKTDPAPIAYTPEVLSGIPTE